MGGRACETFEKGRIVVFSDDDLEKNPAKTLTALRTTPKDLLRYHLKTLDSDIGTVGDNDILDTNSPLNYIQKLPSLFSDNCQRGNSGNDINSWIQR